jgi:hypothetical protein
MIDTDLKKKSNKYINVRGMSKERQNGKTTNPNN